MISPLPELHAPTPESLRLERAALEAAAGNAASAGEWRAVFDAWNERRVRRVTWSNVVQLRFAQDTRDDGRRGDQANLERLAPAMNAVDHALKRRLCEPPARASLEREIGAHAFALWERDLGAFDEAIAGDLVEEAGLQRRYTELVAAATTPYRGKPATLAEVARDLTAAERDARHEAERARWQIFADLGGDLDELFDRLVAVRDRIARRLGFENFLELGYRRMRRTEYSARDVARFRDEIAATVVPLVAAAFAERTRAAGLERCMFWDEAALAAGTEISPRTQRSELLATAVDALAALDGRLGSFAEMMRERALVDADARPGKAFGAFCTSFPLVGVPYVLMNANGSRADVRTLVHELGHAFQSWSSRDKAVLDYRSATKEAAEVHSMSLEFLSWPVMDRFFGASADAYRREHLFDALAFLPYAAAVDHFQHLAYEHPGANSADRHEMWHELERRYLPWREYGDLAYPALGRLWQEKRHIFTFPLYYIDYALAQTCALQMLARAQRDAEGTLAAYAALCARGGEAAFTGLVRSCGLASPFEEGTLASTVDAVWPLLDYSAAGNV